MTRPTPRSTSYERGASDARRAAAALIRDNATWVGQKTAEHLANLISAMPLPKTAKEHE